MRTECTNTGLLKVGSFSQLLMKKRPEGFSFIITRIALLSLFRSVTFQSCLFKVLSVSYLVGRVSVNVGL